MEGVYTFAVATAISVLIVNLVGFRPNKLTVLLIALLYMTAIAVWFIPIFPAVEVKLGVQSGLTVQDHLSFVFGSHPKVTLYSND